MDKTKILFVCLGNICRSPSAEAIMKHLVDEAGLKDRIVVDSAGILAYHEGELPDERMRDHGRRRGYNLISRSRPVTSDDFYFFDLIVGMDDSNIDALMRKAPDVASKNKIRRMTDFSQRFDYDHIPDPYYGGAKGFELTLDLLEDACRGLLDELAGGANS